MKIEKIAIVGNPGSGKSTLAITLHKMLRIPLYHLDQYFWKPGWQRPDRTEFAKTHHELCDKGSGLSAIALVKAGRVSRVECHKLLLCASIITSNGFCCYSEDAIGTSFIKW